MALFTFLGTPECPDKITLRDVEFPKGVPVDVEDADFIAKLDRLDYFEQSEPPPRRGRPRKA
jgi:hypothetical protein